MTESPLESCSGSFDNRQAFQGMDPCPSSETGPGKDRVQLTADQTRPDNSSAHLIPPGSLFEAH